VQAALAKVEGVKSVKVDFAKKQATVSVDKKNFNQDLLINAFKETRFKASNAKS